MLRNLALTCSNQLSKGKCCPFVACSGFNKISLTVLSSSDKPGCSTEGLSIVQTSLNCALNALIFQTKFERKLKGKRARPQYIMAERVNPGYLLAGRPLRSKGSTVRTETSGGVIKIEQSGFQNINL